MNIILDTVLTTAASAAAAAIVGAVFRLVPVALHRMHVQISADTALKISRLGSMVQDATANAAGRIAGKVVNGEITSKADMLRAAAAEEEIIKTQYMPGVMAELKPAPGALAGGIMGKLPAQIAAAQAVPAAVVVTAGDTTKG